MTTTGPGSAHRLTMLDRAIAMVRAGNTVDCIEWPGSRLPDGYAQGRNPGHSGLQYAHRMVYERLVGKIANGLQLDHLCKNRACVNPTHLEPVTPRENTRRSASFVAAQMAKTHCPNGHPYDWVDAGKRRCRACYRANQNAAWARRVTS